MKATMRSKAKHQAMLWLDMGWPRHRIDEHLSKSYNATPEDTTLLVSEIRHEQQGAMSIDRQEFLAQQMTRLEALAVRAQGDGNLAVALGCYRELHLLARLTGKG